MRGEETVYTRRRCNRGTKREKKRERERERVREWPRGRELFSQVPCSPLWGPWPGSALARPGRCSRSVVDEFSLHGLASLSITEKRLHSRGTFNPDAGFYHGWKRRIICFCAVPLARPRRTRAFPLLPSPLLRVPRVYTRACTICVPIIWRKGTRSFMENMSNRR